MHDEIAAREAGDRIFVEFTRDDNGCASARSSGLGLDNPVNLGLAPQALCFRPLKRAGTEPYNSIHLFTFAFFLL
jgi:hypothetical protein